MTSLHHSFDVSLAEKYGICEAILIHHMQHWISLNQRLKKNFHHGKTWMYQKLEEIAAHFTYLTKSQVFDLLEKLCVGKNRKSKKEELDFEPVLIKGKFNKHSYDQTVWYAFVDESKFLTSQEIGKSQSVDWEIPKPIPDTKTDARKESDTLKERNPKERKETSKKEIPPDPLILLKEDPFVAEQMLHPSKKDEQRFETDRVLGLTPEKSERKIREVFPDTDRFKDLYDHFHGLTIYYIALDVEKSHELRPIKDKVAYLETILIKKIQNTKNKRKQK